MRITTFSGRLTTIRGQLSQVAPWTYPRQSKTPTPTARTADAATTYPTGSRSRTYWITTGQIVPCRSHRHIRLSFQTAHNGTYRAVKHPRAHRRDHGTEEPEQPTRVQRARSQPWSRRLHWSLQRGAVSSPPEPLLVASWTVMNQISDPSISLRCGREPPAQCPCEVSPRQRQE